MSQTPEVTPPAAQSEEAARQAQIAHGQMAPEQLGDRPSPEPNSIPPLLRPVRALVRAMGLRGNARNTTGEQPFDVPSADTAIVEEAPPTPPAERLSERGERFWGDEAHVASAPTFAEQLAEAEQHPERRASVITTDPAGIIGRPYDRALRSRLYFTEAEGLLDLRDFLDDVRETAGTDSSAEGQEMAQDAAAFQEHMTFLSAEEYEVACDGIADMWAEYVAQGPDHILNIYERRQEGDYRKSYNVVLKDIYERFLARAADKGLGERVRLSSGTWLDAEHARLVVVDDWATSGHTIEKSVQYAASWAHSRGLPDLARKAEAHILIARAGQIQRVNGEEQRDPFTLRAYYQAPGEPSRMLAPLSGTYSSVDYGFEMPLERMQKYLVEQGRACEVPLLTHIQRSYQVNKKLQAPGATALLTEIATLNAKVTELENREWALRQEQRKPGFDLSVSEQVGEVMAQISAINARRNELCARYESL